MGNKPSSVKPIGPGEHVLRLSIPSSVAEALLSDGMKIHLAVPSPSGLPFQPIADYRGPLSSGIRATPSIYNQEIRRRRRSLDPIRTMRPRKLFEDETERQLVDSIPEDDLLDTTMPPYFDLDEEDQIIDNFINDNLIETFPPVFPDDQPDEILEPEVRQRTPSSRYPLQPAKSPQTAPRLGTPQRIRYIRQVRTQIDDQDDETYQQTRPAAVEYSDTVAEEANRLAREVNENRRRTFTVRKGPNRFAPYSRTSPRNQRRQSLDPAQLTPRRSTRLSSKRQTKSGSN